MVQSLAVSLCCVLEQVTISPLLLSTQHLCEMCFFLATSSLVKTVLKFNELLVNTVMSSIEMEYLMTLLDGSEYVI